MDKLAQLCERLNDLIDVQLAEGHYKTGDEVIRAIAELLEEREKSLAALKTAIEKGENSGPFQPFDFDEFIARKMKEREKVSS